MPARILIADDNAVFRKTLRQLLEAADRWEIVEAYDGQEAVSKSVENQPDVIILDLAMPKKDGFAAAREISRLLPQTPILMCTMHGSSHVEAEARKSGVRKVLSKADTTPLLSAIKQLLGPKEIPASSVIADGVIHYDAVAVDPTVIPPVAIATDATMMPASALLESTIAPSTPLTPTEAPTAEQADPPPAPKSVA